MSGPVEIFRADDVKASGGSAGGGPGKGEAGERGHDEGLWRLGFFGLAQQEADAGAVDAGRVRGGGLRDDDSGISGCGDVGDYAEFKPKTTDVNGGGALALAEDVGNSDLLSAKAFGDADGPLAADGGARGGRLGEDVSGRRVGGVEPIFEGEAEAAGTGLLAGVGEGEAG